MFIRVTSMYSRNPIYVNIDHISSVHVHTRDDDTIDGAVLSMLGGKHNIFAAESMEDIYNQIEYMRMQNIHVREINT